jgi:hypothetical protein
MAGSGKSILLAGALVLAVGSAYAADPQQAPQASQLSSAAPQAPVAAPTILHPKAAHFEPPPGYYQNPSMVPYSRPNYGPKPN